PDLPQDCGLRTLRPAGEGVHVGGRHQGRRPEERPRPLTNGERAVVTVVPDVAGLDGKTFTYLVPEQLRDQVRVGTLVRVALAGRRVGAWVVAVDVDAPPGVTLK